MSKISDPITIKDAKVRILSTGVTPVKDHLKVVAVAVANPTSNRLHATPDRQAIALYMVAMVATMAKAAWCSPVLADRREWSGPSFIVDASSMVGAPLVGDDGKDSIGKLWNDQAFIVSALRWSAGVAGIHPLNIGMVRLDDCPNRHHFKVMLQYIK